MTHTQSPTPSVAAPDAPAPGGSGRLRALRQPDVWIPLALIGIFLVLWAFILTRPNFVTDFDSWVRDRVQSVSHSPDDDKPHWPPLKHLADLGGGVAIHKVPVRIQLPMAAIGAAALFGAVLRRSWRPVLAGAAGYGALGFVLMLKANGHRPGPGMAGKVLHGGLGYFPSGHTANTVLGYGTAALILAFVFRSHAARVTIAAVMTLFALAMGFSLIWLDYHWLTDVLGSYALCGAALFGVARVLGFRLRHSESAS